MAHLPLDAFDDTGQWTATAADGTPSTAVGLVDAAGPLGGRAALAVEIGSGARGHRVERELGPFDLRPFSDLQLWVRADRDADPEVGFLVELAAGAGDLAVDAPSNRWRRLVPVAGARRWQPVLLGVGDLPDRVRRGLRRLRLTVVTDVSGRIELSSLSAVRPELVGDVEAALVGALDGAVEIDGQAVPAVVAPDQPPGPAGRPHLRIRSTAVRPAPERHGVVPLRTDFTTVGFALRPAPLPVDLEYAVDAVAQDRAAQRSLVELLVARFPPTGTLVVNDRPLPLEWSGPLAPAGEPPVPSAPLRIASAQPAPTGARPAIPPFNEIRVEVDQGA
ncbi:MAG: hypothetical protein AB7L84_06980 [Acidimicrobiia bacterium]